MMDTKLFEVRDRGTFLPVIATLMASEPSNTAMCADTVESRNAEAFLLRRAGYGSDPCVLLTPLGGSRYAECDPFAWGDRTLHVAHEYIAANWDRLKSGDVVDVEYVLGETAAPKASER